MTVATVADWCLQLDSIPTIPKEIIRKKPLRKLLRKCSSLGWCLIAGDAGPTGG